jgi:hypothetical protein
MGLRSGRGRRGVVGRTLVRIVHEILYASSALTTFRPLRYAVTTDDLTCDVFLCYRFDNGEAAEALRQSLQALGLRVFRDYPSQEDWDEMAPTISSALLHSRTLVAIITPDFYESPHCRYELHTALTAAYQMGDGDTSRVMAVGQGVGPDAVRPSQLTRYRLPRDGKPPPELAAEIARMVRKIEALDPRMFGDAPAPPDASWYPREMPGDRFFRGRYKELWELHEGLQARTKNRDRGHPVVSVRGAGGLGKTKLCLQYARLFAADHPGGVFVINLAGSYGRSKAGDAVIWTRYLEQVALIGEALPRRIPGDEGQNLPHAVGRALDADGLPYLWVVDDVPSDTSEDLLSRLLAPTPLGKTLLTTRGHFSRLVSQEVELPPLEIDVGSQVVTAHRRLASEEHDQRRDVRDIVKLLGAHPLGLTLAAGLTTLPDFGGYALLLQQLSSTDTDLLEVASQLKDELPVGCAPPFTAALMRSFEALGPAGREALCAASVLAPTPIPFDLISGMARRASSAGVAGIDEGLGQAAERGLVELSPDHSTTMHALVARAVRLRIQPSTLRLRLRDAAVAELTEAVEGTRGRYTHRRILAHLPHVRAVAGLLAGGDGWKVADDERHLMHEAGRVYTEAGATRTALELFATLHAACDVADDVDAVTRLRVLTALAALHGLQGEHSIALRLKEEAAAGLSRELGEDHPDTVTAMNNVAVTCLALGEYGKAYAFLMKVYRQRRARFGVTGRDTLLALNNLAIARGHLDGSVEKRRWHQRAAHRYWLGAELRWRQISRPDDANALDVLNGVALSYRSLGMLQHAHRVQTELYQRRAELLGPHHPDTLGTQENRLVLEGEGAADSTGPSSDGFQELYLSRLRGQGPDHPDTLTTLRNLLLHELRREGVDAPRPTLAAAAAVDLPGGSSPDDVNLEGDHVDAQIDAQQRAIELQEHRVQTLGPDHPQTMIATCYLAHSLAVADHIGGESGQLASASVLAKDACDGLADAAEESSEGIGGSDVETAELVNQWILAMLEP